MVFDCNTITLDFDMPLPLGESADGQGSISFLSSLDPRQRLQGIFACQCLDNVFFWLLCAAMWKMKMCGHKGQCVTVPQTTDPILVFWG